ncbi:MAG: hypothetical protein LBG10_02745, partial [Treponema sp.]|nr:hypothetical protein [Treponema sp.]
KLQDETAGMTPEEVADFYNKKAEAFLAPMGKSLCYDRVGMGRLLSNPIRGSGRPGDTQSVSLGLERRGA